MSGWDAIWRLRSASRVVAIDGKGRRTALAGIRRATRLGLVNTFALASSLAVGQIGVPVGTGEIVALRELLSLLDLKKGRTVTPTPSTVQRETAQAILGAGADYILGFKSNRFAMYEDALLFLDDPAAVGETAHTVYADHGRRETRRLRLTHDVGRLAERYAFPGLVGLAEVVATREAANGKIATSCRPSQCRAKLRRLRPSRQSAPIGRSNISFTGLSTSPSRTARAPGATTCHSTSPSCMASPSIGCAQTRIKA